MPFKASALPRSKGPRLHAASIAATAALCIACGGEGASFATSTQRLDAQPPPTAPSGAESDSNSTQKSDQKNQAEANKEAGDKKPEVKVEANKASSEDPKDNGNQTLQKPKNTRTERTRLVETFLLPGNEDSKDQFSVPANPFQTTEFQQQILNLSSSSTVVLNKEAPNRAITIKGPVSSSQSHLVSWQGKPVDLFLVIDDSESFSGQPLMADRTKRLLKRLLGNLNGMSWRVFISGLPGNATDDSLTFSSADTTNIDATVDARVNSILQASAMGDEQAFQGLANLAFNRRGSDRDNAVHAYFIISDAPNCKNNANSDSPSCKRVAGMRDHHRYLFDRTNAILPNYMQHMSLFGAYYRMTDASKVCSALDTIEVPAPGENLKMNSQYADLAFFWEKFLFPTTPDSAKPSWVGDICGTTENLDFIDSYVSAIKNLAQHRFALANAFENFSANPEFNFSLSSSGNAVLSANFRTVANQFVIINQGAHTGETLLAKGSISNGYRQTDFNSALDSPARSGSVTLSWLEDGAQKSVACQRADSFSSLDASVPCRHSQTSIYFRNYDALPKLLPANPAQTQTLTVQYERDVPLVTSITVNAQQDIILPESIQFVAAPSTAGTPVPKYSQSVNGKTITLSFPSPLPAGLYTVRYFDKSSQAFSVQLPSDAVTTKASPVCHLPGQTASSNTRAIGLDTGTAIPCSLGADNKTLFIDSVIPVNAASGQRDFKVSYFASVAAKSEFELSSPPSDNTVVVRRFAAGDENGTILPESEYQLSNARIRLNSALQPGEKITVNYQFLPDLGDGCFLLSGKAIIAEPYLVKVGTFSQETTLDRSNYKITEESSQRSKICLNESVLTHGLRIQVSYLAGVVVTEE